MEVDAGFVGNGFRVIMVGGVGFLVFGKMDMSRWAVDEGLYVDVPQLCERVLWPVIEELILQEDADALAVSEKFYLIAFVCEVGDADECVRGSIDYSDFS